MNTSKHVKFLLSLIFIVSSTLCNSQEKFEFPLVEHNYLPNIQSSKLYNIDIRKERPIWMINSQYEDQTLTLLFDDMDADTKYYEFSIIHATADWKQSDLDITEYSHGFLRTELEDYAFSVQTKESYTTYSYEFNLENIPWYKSGNYLLVVWDVTDDEQVAFTKRFFVVEQEIVLNVNSTLPILTGNQRTHHAFEVSTELKNIKIFNPKKELILGVYQNMRWDNPLINTSFYTRLGDLYRFGRTDEISFPAVNEFRSLDIRSAKYRSADIAILERSKNKIEMLAEIDYPRAYKEYLFLNDRNGTFFFENHDRKLQADIRMEYVEVLFTLQMKELYDHKVYITGPHINWEILPEYEMTFDENRKSYFLEALLKQGYYDYTYIAQNIDTHEKNITAIEGSTFKTDNDYIFFLYHRKRGERYDQIIGVKYFSNISGPLTMFDIR